MTTLRQSAIAKLEKVPEDRLGAVIQFINQLIEASEPNERTWDLDQFVMPPTQRGQDADAYVRELRDHDSFHHILTMEDLMINDELRAKLRKGLEDAQAGQVQDADTAFQAFRGNL